MTVFRRTESDSDHIKQTRELTRNAREALKKPCPDTFAGRKTQEPFPKEDDGSHISRWLHSRELQPPK